MVTNKNASFRSCQTAAAAATEKSTLVLNINSRHRGSWTPPKERKREMEKEKRDAALAKIVDEPSFPFIFIGGTRGSCAGAAYRKQSSRFFRHETPVNKRNFLHEFIYTIPEMAMNKNASFRSCQTAAAAATEKATLVLNNSPHHGGSWTPPKRAQEGDGQRKGRRSVSKDCR